MRIGLLLLVRLTHRLARGRALLPGALVVGVFSAFVMIMFVGLSALSLSGPQLADRDLGRYGAFLGFGSLPVLPGDSQTAPRLQRAANLAGANDAQIMLFAADVQITDDPRNVWQYIESDWAVKPFPQRYELVSGRWPAVASEVVIAAPPPGAPMMGQKASVFGRMAHVTVVGYAEDKFDNNPVVLAGSGTWATLPVSVAQEFVTAPAQPVLFWSGNNPDKVVEAFTRAVAGIPGGVPEGVASSGSTRETVVAFGEPTWLQRSPAAFQIPAVALPLLAVALLFGANDARLRRLMSMMIAVGVQRRLGVLAAGLAVLLWSVSALLLGSAIGLALGLVLRPLLSVLTHHPAGPVAGVQTPFMTGLLAVVAATLLGGLLLGRSRSNAPSPLAGSKAFGGITVRTGTRTHVRQVFGACVLVVAGGAVPAVDTVARVSYLSAALTLAALLLLPEIVGLSLRLLPEHTPRARLARRRMLADRASVTAAVGLSMFLLTATLGYTVLFSSVITSLKILNYPDVLPGQVLVQGRAPVVEPPPSSALAVIEEAGLDVNRDGTVMAYSLSVDQQGRPEQGAQVVGAGLVLVLPDTSAVMGLIGRSLSGEESGILNANGGLFWEGVPNPAGFVTLEIIDAAEAPVRQLTIRGVPISEPRAGWATGASGIVLASTARAHKLPVGTGSVILVDLDDRQIEEIENVLATSGVDAQTILVPRAPPPIIPNTGLVLTVLGLVVVAIVGVVIGTRTQLRGLRGYAAQLDSLGLPRRWVGTVLVQQTAFVACLATVLAVLIGLPPVLIAASNIPGLDVYIPAGDILALSGSVYLATILTSVLAARRVSVRSHLREA